MIKRQAYYVGGQGQGGGGSGQETLDPREFMKRARDEMGAQTVGEQAAMGPPPSSSFTGQGYSLSGASVDGGAAPKPPEEHTIVFGRTALLWTMDHCAPLKIRQTRHSSRRSTAGRCPRS